MVHSRIRVGHPQSNGKLEGFPKTRERLPSPFNSLAPFDYLKGKDPIKHRLEVRKTSLELARQDHRQKQKQALSRSLVSVIGTDQNGAIYVDIAQCHQ